MDSSEKGYDIVGKHIYGSADASPIYVDEDIAATIRKLICPSKGCGGVMKNMEISLMSDKTILHRCVKCKAEVYTEFSYPRLIWK